MAFVERQISLTFEITDPDSQAVTRTLIIDGLRIACDVVVAGYGDMPTAQLQIFGLSPDLMNELSTIGSGLARYRKNNVMICAGDAGSPLSQIFVGQITAAWADYHQAPNVSFNVQAMTGVDKAMLDIGITSFPNPTNVADILKVIVDKINAKSNQHIAFIPNGVNVSLDTQYLAGDARSQCFEVVKTAKINWNNFDNGTLEIWPMGGSRSGDSILVAAETGMVGYPTFTYNGMIVTTLFNPRLRYGVLVEVNSSIPSANQKDWWIAIVTHELDSQMPNGRWFSTIDIHNPAVDKPLDKTQ